MVVLLVLCDVGVGVVGIVVVGVVGMCVDVSCCWW
jgi:hypothetical protein